MTALHLTMIAAAGVLGILLRRALVARRDARKRVVEQPNSHYAAPLVRESETRHRWQSMRLDNMHEVNRAEIQRLLARVEAAGVDALRPGERSFLDYMASLGS